MRQAIAIYHAPEGDSKVVEMGGVTFFDGQPVDLNSNDHPHLMSKIEGNQHFEVEMGEEEVVEKPKRKYTRSVNLKDAMTAAGDHNFEADRRETID